MIEVVNNWDIVCNLCILILENLSHMTGLSYGFLNIVLFVIMGPLATLLFMSSAITLFIKTQKRKLQKVIAGVLFTLGVLMVLAIIIPIIIATLELPF